MSKTQPLVTIAIPTYNRADSYLKQSLQSVMNQTYQNIEKLIYLIEHPEIWPEMGRNS
jgi:glycosyltransferase involved in cell wall biosynthesis